MSDILSQFPGIISSITGPTALIALFALLVFGTAIVMFGKEGTKVKMLIFGAILAVVLMAISASIEFESSRQNQTQKQNGSNEIPVNSISPQNVGLAAGSIAQPCGCWGYVNFGARDAEPRCASGWAQAVGCQATCLAGGYQWMIQCL